MKYKKLENVLNTITSETDFFRIKFLNKYNFEIVDKYSYQVDQPIEKIRSLVILLT